MSSKVDYYIKKLVAYLKRVGKTALFRRLGAPIGGIWGLIASALFEFSWSKYIHPYLLHLGRRVQAYFLRKKTEKKVDELEEAKTDSDIKSSFDKLP